MVKSKIIKSDIEEFYNALAHEYDTMTSFERRIVKEKGVFQALVKRYKIKTALDAGAGSGVHSLILAKSNVSVTAVDISEKMLQHLSKHTQRQNLKIKTLKTDFLELPRKVHQNYDAIFCMGNSLAHTQSQKKLKKIIKNFYKLLNPNGILFIQILNYDRILLNREIIQSIKASDETIFIRFYAFCGKYIDFHILTINRNGKTIQYKIQTTRLRPIKQKEIIMLLKEIGFKKIIALDGLMGNKFSKCTSRDLVINAFKSQQ